MLRYANDFCFLKTDLMYFLPPLQVGGSNSRMVMQQRFAQQWVRLVRHREIQWRQRLAVLVVRRGAKFQQRLHSF